MVAYIARAPRTPFPPLRFRLFPPSSSTHCDWGCITRPSPRTPLFPLPCSHRFPPSSSTQHDWGCIVDIFKDLSPITSRPPRRHTSALCPWHAAVPAPALAPLPTALQPCWRPGAPREHLKVPFPSALTAVGTVILPAPLHIAAVSAPVLPPPSSSPCNWPHVVDVFYGPLGISPSFLGAPIRWPPRAIPSFLPAALHWVSVLPAAL
ncbi:hypothetical protein B0H13DRAFT_2354906 [Mycena leptocephala]|nr:hypothetical protein B0H13DRAFT_2354906 [Mycena leptocephala]